MVSVNLILRDNLILKAQSAKEEYESAAQKEAISLNEFETEVNKYITTGSGDNESDEVVWGALESGGNSILAYTGTAKKLKITSKEIQVEIYNQDGTGTGEIKAANLDNYNIIMFYGSMFDLNLEEIDFGGQLKSNVLIQIIGLQNITTIKGLEGWTNIVDENFKNCTSLKNIELPTSITNIGIAAFMGCTSLESIVIPSNVTIIKESAFRDCTSLTSVRISGSVDTILESAFRDCISLESIEIPSNVTRIENSAFTGCTNLKTIKVNRTLSDAEATLGTSWIPSGATVTYNDQVKTY